MLHLLAELRARAIVCALVVASLVVGPVTQAAPLATGVGRATTLAARPAVGLPIVPVIASGAIGRYRIDQYATAGGRGYIPNLAAATLASPSLLGPQRRRYASTFGSGAITDSYAASQDGIAGDASRVLSTGYNGQGVAIVQAGTYSLWANVKSNTNADQTFRSQLYDAGISQTNTATPVYQRMMLASGNLSTGGQLVLPFRSPDDTAQIDLVFHDVELFAGTADLHRPLAGHLMLGTGVGTKAPSYAAGVLDASADGAAGYAQFPAAVATSGAFTAQAMVRKTAVGSGYQSFLSSMPNFQAWTAWLEQSGTPQFTTGAGAYGAAGLYRRKDYGKFVVITHRYDGSKYSIYLDDIPFAEAAGSAITGLQDLWFNVVNGAFSSGDVYAGEVLLYDRALTPQQVVDNGSAMRAEAQAAGVAANLLGPLTDFVVIEGDSRDTSGPQMWPDFMGAGLSRPIFGTTRAVGGSGLDSGSNQVAARIAAAPAFPVRTGLRVYGLLGVMGANDLGGYAGASDAAAAAAYKASEGANVFDAWTAKGVNRRVMLTEIPFGPSSLGAGTAAHNNRKDLLNASLRNSFPGSNGGTLIDLDAGDARWADNEGGNDYTVLYQSATNGHPSTAGHQSIGSIAAAGFNPLLAQ